MQLVHTGKQDPGFVYVRFYLSADTLITTKDFALGQTNAVLSAGSTAMMTVQGTFPTSIPEGTYYVGWIIDPEDKVSEDVESNNAITKSSLKLKVVDPAKPIIYVDAEARGANDGSSWQNAFTSLQDGLAIAGAGHEVHVADGTYTPDRGIRLTRGNRKASFEITGGVTILGGFAGTGASDPDARDSKLYPTILSGDLNANDRPVADPCNLATEPSRTDNSWHVVAVVDAERTVTLDGVQITGGSANPPSLTAAGDSLDALAAGLAAADSQGAGLYLWSANVLLRGCAFAGNWASGDGGAIYAADSHVELIDCAFRANGAGINPRIGQPRGTGGAIRTDGKSELTVSRGKFLGNFAGAQGGAIDHDQGNALLTGCLFLQNATGRNGGGAIWNSEGKLSLVNCTLAGNRSDSSGGALANGYSGTLTAVNCCLHGNYARSQAGALDNFFGGQATLTNCTLADNYQGGTPGVIVCGPALGPSTGGLSVSNCILWNGGSEIVTQGKAPVTVTRTNIQGGWTGVANLSANPLFVRPAGADGVLGTEDDDLRLGADSPCINRGDLALLPPDFGDLDGDGNTTEPLPFDLDGKARVTGVTVDLGAYEAGSCSGS